MKLVVFIGLRLNVMIRLVFEELKSLLRVNMVLRLRIKKELFPHWYCRSPLIEEINEESTTILLTLTYKVNDKLVTNNCATKDIL